MEPTSFVVIYLIGYFFILLLAFAIPAAVIIVIAVKHKKEEDQKRFLFMQMMADIDRRNAEKAKERAQQAGGAPAELPVQTFAGEDYTRKQ